GVTAEMMLLFTFVILGTSLIWSGFTGVTVAAVIFTIFAMLIRVPVYLLSLLGSKVDRRGRLLIAWFGPSGLSSLLLVLLPVFAGLPGSERLFSVTSLIVLLSVVIHGGSPMLLAGKSEEQKAAGTPEVPPAPVEPVEPAKPERALPVITESEPSTQEADGAPIGAQSITLQELDELQKSGEPVIILDVRTERSIEDSDLQVRGAVRLPPEHVAIDARDLGLPKNAWLIAHCA
ncbi:MAG TPA: hypothetical protein VFH91_09805, partial [Pyrinomonadaceae bacterium]|nr:hypothetical protein [Pyrinomonadaceae bacterium]